MPSDKLVIEDVVNAMYSYICMISRNVAYVPVPKPYCEINLLFLTMLECHSSCTRSLPGLYHLLRPVTSSVKVALGAAPLQY